MEHVDLIGGHVVRRVVVTFDATMTTATVLTCARAVGVGQATLGEMSVVGCTPVVSPAFWACLVIGAGHRGAGAHRAALDRCWFRYGVPRFRYPGCGTGRPLGARGVLGGALRSNRRPAGI